MKKGGREPSRSVSEGANNCFANIMKSSIVSFFFFMSLNCSGQISQPEFGLYFGNDFKSDSVTIYINGVQVARNIELRNRMYDPMNLMIEQNRQNISVMPYNKPKQVSKKVGIKNSILILDIKMNTIWRSFRINLQTGKYLYAKYKYIRVGWCFFKILEIKQQKWGPFIL